MYNWRVHEEERGISILTNFEFNIMCFLSLIIRELKFSGLYAYFDRYMRKCETVNMNFSRMSSTSTCKRNSTVLQKFRVTKVWSAIRLLQSLSKFREFKIVQRSIYRNETYRPAKNKNFRNFNIVRMFVDRAWLLIAVETN